MTRDRTTEIADRISFDTQMLTTELTETHADDLLDELEEVSPAMASHTRRTGELVLRTLVTLNPDIPSKVVTRFAYAATLHDVGKAHKSIVRLVNSGRRLSQAEIERVRGVHAVEGAARIHERITPSRTDAHLVPLAAFVAEHHHDTEKELNRLALSPNHKLGMQVTRMAHFADVLDALTDPERLYRKPISTSEAVHEVLLDARSEGTLGIRSPRIMAVMSDVHANYYRAA